MADNAAPYRVEALAYGETKWATNAMRYETREAAEKAAEDLYVRWTMVDKYRVVSDDVALNERYAEGSETGP